MVKKVLQTFGYIIFKLSSNLEIFYQKYNQNQVIK